MCVLLGHFPFVVRSEKCLHRGCGLLQVVPGTVGGQMQLDRGAWPRASGVLSCERPGAGCLSEVL